MDTSPVLDACGMGEFAVSDSAASDAAETLAHASAAVAQREGSGTDCAMGAAIPSSVSSVQIRERSASASASIVMRSGYSRVWCASSAVTRPGCTHFQAGEANFRHSRAFSRPRAVLQAARRDQVARRMVTGIDRGFQARFVDATRPGCGGDLGVPPESA